MSNQIHKAQLEASLQIADPVLRAEYLSACSIEQATGNREPLKRFQQKYARYIMNNAK